MARGPVKTSRPVASLVLGLAGTAAVLAAHLAGLGRRAELAALDLRFRHCARPLPAGDVLHVDIDDGSLSDLGRWPWPRETLAGIIDVLAECDARAVVLDIIMPEPQAVRYVSPAGEIYHGIGGALIGEDVPTPVFDDALLAGAIRRGPRAALPMHVDFGEDRPGGLQERLERLLAADPAVTVAAAGDRLGCSRADLEAVWRRALAGAVDARVGEALAGSPDESYAAVLAKVLPGPRPAAAVEMTEQAYLRRRAVAAMERFAVPADRVAGVPARSGTMVPPLVTLAQAAGLSGFVTVVPDEDGVVRRIPLLARGGGRVYPQFALALAAAELAGTPAGPPAVSAQPGAVVIQAPAGGARRIPVDADGSMLIHWSGRSGGPAHISSAGVGRIWQARQRIALNRRRLRVTQVALARQLGQEDLKRLFAQADELHLQRLAADRRRCVADLYDPANVPPPPTALVERERAVEAAIDKAAAEFRKELDDFYIPKTPPAGDQRQAYDRLVEDRSRWDQALAASAVIAAGIREDLARIRPLVAGKICMIGSTSTGAADFVPTPTAARMPGVEVHAAILRTILSGSFLRRAAPWADVLAVLLAGGLVTVLAATRPVVLAGPVTVALAAAYAAVNGLVVFGRWHVWLGAVAPIAAMAAALLMVTACRQLTEERAKRQIRGMFAHALSPALVDRLLEDPSIAALGGQSRTLTCMFSDIAGYTPLSNRLGPPRTVRLLNRYFDRMTEVIQDRGGGYLNKFLGDGIFCFFGAPVFQDDHPARAVRAAVECLAEVERLNQTLPEHLGEPARIAIRLGIATGEAIVGNCGSTQRMDYTAIGDCVNLASRLEGANKTFSSRILVTERSWRLCRFDEGAAPLSRPLGAIYVAGVPEAVAVREVLPPGGEARAAFIADFAGALDLFARRQFDEALRAFEHLHQTAPDDEPTRIYLDLCRQGLAGQTDQPPQVATHGPATMAWPWEAPV